MLVMQQQCWIAMGEESSDFAPRRFICCTECKYGFGVSNLPVHADRRDCELFLILRDVMFLIPCRSSLCCGVGTEAVMKHGDAPTGGAGLLLFPVAGGIYALGFHSFETRIRTRQLAAMRLWRLGE